MHIQRYMLEDRTELMVVVKRALRVELIGRVFKYMKDENTYIDFQETQETINNLIKKTLFIIEREIMVSFKLPVIKIAKANEINKKVIFFQKMSSTVNENEFYLILDRKSINKQLKLTKQITKNKNL
jgi:hypothetical protein